MKHTPADYPRYVEWSEEDQCYIGRCPDLFTSGCHGDDPGEVAEELEALIAFVIEGYEKRGKPLPAPSARPARLKGAHPARAKAGVSQKAFADIIGVSADTIRRVEQGGEAKGATRTLLHLLEQRPALIDDLRGSGRRLAARKKPAMRVASGRIVGRKVKK